MTIVCTKKFIHILLASVYLIQPFTITPGNSCSASFDDPVKKDLSMASACNVQPVEIVHNGRRITVNIPLAPGQKPLPRALEGTVVHTPSSNRAVYVHVHTPSSKSSRRR